MSICSSDDSAWTAISGELDSGPFILRHLSDLEPRSDLGNLLRIVWIYADENTGALPDEFESRAMTDFENILVDRFENDGLAMLTAALTFDGSRQWVWYTSDVSECGDRLNNLPSTEEPYPIEIDAEEDPEWGYLRNTIIGSIANGT